MNKLRILLTGGGSGGHIYALIAVVEELRKQAQILNLSLDIRYFGDPKEYRINFEALDVKITHIASSKLRRYLSWRVFLDVIKFLWSIPQSLFKIFWFMPDIAFSKGGSGVLSVLYVCRFYRIPIIIHDSDAIPGLTTRASAKFARVIELAFENAAAYFKDTNKVRVVGHPVRNLAQAPFPISKDIRDQAKFDLKFESPKPLILILGGSQGAQIINNFIFNNLKEFLKEFQILHQVGLNNFQDYQKKLKTILNLSDLELKNYQVVPFLDRDYKLALTASDIVVSRAGAGAIFELAASGKPSILIPLTNSAQNHQRENASQYAAAQATVVIAEENLFANLIIREIKLILENSEKLRKMQESAKNFYKPNAARDIADDIFKIIKST